jgi:hypothetical protein
MALVVLAVVAAFGGAIGVHSSSTTSRAFRATDNRPSLAAVSGAASTGHARRCRASGGQLLAAVNHQSIMCLASRGARDPGAARADRISHCPYSHSPSQWAGAVGVIRSTAQTVLVSEAWSLTAERLAAIVTVIAHSPLQTERWLRHSADRVLVSFCYLATLYASIRAWDAETKRIV